MSGPGILPVSLRAVYECREAFPDAGIVGVGGVSSGEDAVAMMMAGANAVEVGTATFADPRAPWIVQRELDEWMRAPRRRVDRRTDRGGPWLKPQTFGERLQEHIRELGPLCVGVDPSASCSRPGSAPTPSRGSSSSRSPCSRRSSAWRSRSSPRSPSSSDSVRRGIACSNG